MTTVRDEPTLVDRLRAGATEHFGKFGFDQSMLEISIALDVDGSTLSDLFGSVNGLRAVCDEYVLSSIRAAKTESLSARDPGTWLTQIAGIESFAPTMSYLVRSLQAGDELGHTLLREMIENAATYLEDAVGTGTVKPSRDPKARARFLATSVGGGFLLYLRMHQTPEDMREVLRDYARDMIIPAVELYTQGLMADDTMSDAFLNHSLHV
ncbi:TetR/AcrR family transcriptional regulator [Mycolicibacterium hodleri]|uniref:TetR/AcrR family transcriptional regulator n=1 Tax=Mycolicibacterium hodleri TaxID=49897 RepID=A0A502E5D4_9MYCO|nr:TetR/AcrR family transcriptional regulator [Mycolicibacterium hodleri]TPG32707.1 TetR/AcrR family transcriptional regulator [Mycolicibacterium hodleri]